MVGTVLSTFEWLDACIEELRAQLADDPDDDWTASVLERVGQRAVPRNVA